MRCVGFKAHAAKHEPLALHLLEQTINLGLQFRFKRLGGRESVNDKTQNQDCGLDCFPLPWEIWETRHWNVYQT